MYSLKDLHFEIPEDVSFILKTLNDAGFEAFAVGGCVRDVILGKAPDDWDITTSAKPEQVKKLFRRTIDTGIVHGTVTVMLKKTGYEVTTYRIDGEYKDGRHPEEVSFTSNLVEDLKRRDFTINAMAYNPAYGVVDEFGGVDDLNCRLIRCVGDPVERFGEDALRILRAIRFSAQLGFDIEEKTYQAISMLKENLTKISKERIRVELNKTLCSKEPQKIRLLYETGVSSVITPWFDEMMRTTQNSPYHCYSVGEHTIHVVQSVENNPILRWAALLHDVAKPQCKTTDEDGRDHFHGHQEIGKERAFEILRDLRFDNHTISLVTRLILVHDLCPELSQKGVRWSIYQVGEDLYPYYLKLKKADACGKSELAKEESSQELDYLCSSYQQIITKKHCFSLKDLAVSGKNLMQEGFHPGPEIGKMLQQLLEMVVEDPLLNEKEKLLQIAKDIRA